MYDAVPLLTVWMDKDMYVRDSKSPTADNINVTFPFSPCQPCVELVN